MTMSMGQAGHSNRVNLNHDAFTLVEMMIVLAMTGIVMGSIYGIFVSSNRSYNTQEQIVAMRQNLSAAMYFMEREIRLAGCDPTHQSGAAGIVTADGNSIRVTSDIHDGVDNDGDGTVDEDDEVGNADGVIDPTNGNEDITYSLSDNDLERNGILIAENIDALDFVYLNAADTPLDDDGNGNVIANIPNIRSIQITIVAKTGRADPGYTNTAAYANQQGTEILPAQNDSFRRKRLTTEVKCRNLGL